jgi:uncharacterized protein (TIGR02300 family)
LNSPALGLKLTCCACAARFYDLGRSPAVCPKCAAVQPPPKPRAGYPASRRWVPPVAPVRAAAPVVEAEADEEDEPDVIDEDDDDDEPPEKIALED